MDVIKNYQGFKKTVEKTASSIQETYIGFKDKCETFMGGFSAGQITEGLGKLISIDFEQVEGPYWKVVLNWSTEKDEDGNDNPGGYGQKASTLSIRMLSLPIEKAKGYNVGWNYNLFGTENASLPVPWEVTSSLVIPDEYKQNYQWSKNSTLSDGWTMLCEMYKPGVETYDYPIYELTEHSRHNGQTSAGNAVIKKSGKIATPEYGDFGIVNKLGGDWLCEGGSISFNGEDWIASLTYAHSPDGWDKDLYSEE